MTRTKTIDWKPFGDKHKEYIKTALNNRMCVAEGAIRSGKTIDHCIIAYKYLEHCKDKIHLATGSTLGNAKLNIGDCNGYGLEHLFRGRCQWGKYKGNECLKIKTATGEKIVIFSGGKNSDSYKKILGNSYGLWIATEINEHYDADDSRTSFIKVAFGRQAAADRPLVLWDLNPCAPANKIYKDYIDKYKTDFIGGYQYEHFTIDDNLAISEQRKAEIKSQYDINSAWYKRDILGQRCVAEGLIYPMFANAIKEPPKGNAEQYVLSIDYGTMNALSCGLWGLYSGVWYRLKEYYYSGRNEGHTKTDKEYADDITAEFGKYGNEYQKLKTIIDPSAVSFKTEMKRRRIFGVVSAKNAVIDGIHETDSALRKGLIKISPECKNWQEEASGYVWDNCEDEDRPVKINDHAMDDTRYFVKTMRIAIEKDKNITSIFY